MAEFIALFPPIRVAIAVLNTVLVPRREGLKIGSKYPTTDPAQFVRVDRVGGTMSNVVTDNPLMLFECWTRNDSAPNAEALANDVLSSLAAARFGVYDDAFVRWWNPVGCAPLNDPDKPMMSRWEVSGELGLATKRS